MQVLVYGEWEGSSKNIKPFFTATYSEMKKEAAANGWPVKVEWGLIGSCTNSSYEDMSRAASIVQQAHSDS